MDTFRDLVIDLDANINDPLAMGNTNIVRKLLEYAEQVIKNGHTVTLRHMYTNASTDVVAILTKESEIKDLKNKLNDVQKILGKPLI